MPAPFLPRTPVQTENTFQKAGISWETKKSWFLTRLRSNLLTSPPFLRSKVLSFLSSVGSARLSHKEPFGGCSTCKEINSKLKPVCLKTLPGHLQMTSPQKYLYTAWQYFHRNPRNHLSGIRHICLLNFNILFHDLKVLRYLQRNDQRETLLRAMVLHSPTGRGCTYE